MRHVLSAVLLLAAVVAARADDPKPKGDPPKHDEKAEKAEPLKAPADRLAALQKEYDEGMKKFMEEYRAAKNDDERQKAFKLQPDRAAFAKKYLALATDAPKDPVAVDALVWVVNNAGYASEGAKALDLLARDHAADPKVGPVCARLVYMQSAAVEPFLRAVIAKNTDAAARGMACLALGQVLKRQAELVRSLKEDASLAERLGAMAQYGPQRIKELQAMDPAAAEKAAEETFERVVKEFGDVKTGDRPLGPMATAELFEMRHLSVGKAAPDIEGEDVDGQKFKLSDYRGKVILLDFWGNW
jgi:hypothetical protein